VLATPVPTETLPYACRRASTPGAWGCVAPGISLLSQGGLGE
jgi:hypothetical protein